jgi:hypothetical protein
MQVSAYDLGRVLKLITKRQETYCAKSWVQSLAAFNANNMVFSNLGRKSMFNTLERSPAFE